MKKILSVILSISLILSCMALYAYALPNSENEIFISPDGSDGASGTISEPLATLSAAKEKAKSFSGDVTVNFRAGTYTFDNTVCFSSADKENVTYKAYNGEKVVFTAGTPYTGFEECTVNGVKAFKKNVGKSADIRTLFNSETTLKKTRYPENGYLYPKGVNDKYCLNKDNLADGGIYLSYTAIDVKKGDLPNLKTQTPLLQEYFTGGKMNCFPLKPMTTKQAFLNLQRAHQ
ncbi:MAG: hypothetical protein KBT46_05455 [Ruminococcus sp.]|nr:hypothetical protein [Candidatus Copronaster equi]